MIRNMSIVGESRGLEGVGRDVLREATDDAKFDVGAGAFHLKQAMVRNVSGSGGGRLYRFRDRDGTARTHRASSPGEMPATMRGNLARAIKYSTVQARDRGPNIEVESAVGPVGSKRKGTLVVNASARILEHGGLVGRGKKTRVLARPFIRTTVEQERSRVNAILEG